MKKETGEKCVSPGPASGLVSKATYVADLASDLGTLGNGKILPRTG